MSRTRRLDARWLAAHPLPDPDATSNKEQRGRVLVVAGSHRVPGAALLAAMAALHAGAGKLHVATARAVAMPLALQLPEAMVSPLPTDRGGEVAGVAAPVRRAAADTDALLLGPGMQPGDAGQRALRTLACACRGALVLDAGAIVAKPPAPASGLPPILTPHAGELAAALGIERTEVEAEPLDTARNWAREAGCIVVMKGVPTHILAPDGRALTFAVHAPGLGTSGSGDVLAGILAGLLARGTEPFQAAAWAVWLHGRAGRTLGGREGRIGYLARDISPQVPALMAAARGGAATRTRSRQ